MDSQKNTSSNMVMIGLLVVAIVLAAIAAYMFLNKQSSSNSVPYEGGQPKGTTQEQVVPGQQIPDDAKPDGSGGYIYKK